MTDKPTEKKEKIIISEEIPKKKETISYYEAVGRRKTATARTRLYVMNDQSLTIQSVPVEKGGIVVNGRPVEKFFPGEVYKRMYMEPFRTTNTLGRFAVSVKTSGGGIPGQLGATIHAISRALVKVDDEKFRAILKKRGFLMRDPRAKQRRKAGFAGKARARKQSPKR